MTRIGTIILLVGLFLTAGIAGATPYSQVRTPVALTKTTEKSADQVVVQKGDHLWRISARHLGATASNEEITPYWREVIDLNLPTLRSGDPDLIYPGEVVDLPPSGRP